MATRKQQRRVVASKPKRARTPSGKRTLKKSDLPKENPSDLDPKNPPPSKNPHRREPLILKYMRHVPEEYQTFLRYIQAGAWDWVAAEYLGIPHNTFYTWLRTGEENYLANIEDESIELNCYGQFYKDVNRAKMHARMNCEMAVRTADPRYWLKQAAKSKPDRPGWTEDTPEIDINIRDDRSSSIPSAEDAARSQAVLQQIIMGATTFSDTYREQNPDFQDDPPLDTQPETRHNEGSNGDSPKTKTREQKGGNGKP